MDNPSSLAKTSGRRLTSFWGGRRAAWIAVALLVAAYSLAFPWLESSFGLMGRAVCIIYIFVAAWRWGLRGGLISAFLTIFLNALLSMSSAVEVLPLGILGAAGLVFGGAAIGLMGHLNLRLHQELHERRQFENELQRHQQHLQGLVEKRTSDLVLTNDRLHGEIHERRRVEAALKESEERFRELADSLPQTVFEIDDNGRFLFVNQNAFDAFGYSKEDLDGSVNALQMIAPQDRDRAKDNFIKTLKGEDLGGIEYEALTKDGDIFSVILYSNPIISKDRSAGMRGIMVDITDHKRLESNFFRSQRMESIGRLAGGIAHDFNNILTTIVGYSELGMMKLDRDVPLYHDLQEIQRASERAAELTRQLLAFSRRQITEPRVINLNNVLLDMEKMLRLLISEDIELTTQPDESIGSVKVDPAQVEQVIANLAVNARDAMPEGGKLTLDTSHARIEQALVSQNFVVEPGDYVVLSVHDDGIGMTEEVREHIFEPFFTTKKDGKGTGLGLATCYGIVKQNGGYIWADSEPGQGTTFRIYFPRVEGEPEILPEREESHPPGRGEETILLVEDEPSVREIAARVLREHGYRVLEASTGAEALRVVQSLESGRIHLLLTDIVMPELGGRELAKRLVAEDPAIKVILLSGYPGDAIARRGHFSPGRIIIQKPFTPAELARKVRDCLDTPSADVPAASL